MPNPPANLSELEQKRSRLYAALATIGDFRRGALHAVRRKCGKPNCHCAGPDHPGHGPQHNFTRSIGGKTVNVHLKPGPELSKVSREVANYKQFVTLSGQIVEVNEKICDARPASPLAESEAPAEKEAKKGGSFRASKKSLPQR